VFFSGNVEGKLFRNIQLIKILTFYNLKGELSISVKASYLESALFFGQAQLCFLRFRWIFEDIHCGLSSQKYFCSYHHSPFFPILVLSGYSLPSRAEVPGTQLQFPIQRWNLTNSHLQHSVDHLRLFSHFKKEWLLLRRRRLLETPSGKFLWFLQQTFSHPLCNSLRPTFPSSFKHKFCERVSFGSSVIGTRLRSHYSIRVCANPKLHLGSFDHSPGKISFTLLHQGVSNIMIGFLQRQDHIWELHHTGWLHNAIRSPLARGSRHQSWPYSSSLSTHSNCQTYRAWAQRWEAYTIELEIWWGNICKWRSSTCHQLSWFLDANAQHCSLHHHQDCCLPS